MKRICRIGVAVMSLCLITMSVQAQKMLMEDFNDDTLAPGFDFFDGIGFIADNETDNQTWTIYSGTGAWSGWNDFTSSTIISPEFEADAFRVKYAVRNIQRNSQSDWDNIVVRITGLTANLDIYLGSSSANQEIFPDYALYAEIQHPDKANGYIWDSAVNNNGQEVPSPWSDYIDEFPGTIELEIVFNGPQQPLDIYYNFDGNGREHLLPWNSNAAHTFDNVLAKDGTSTYSVAIHANGGGNPPISFDIDSLKISGDIQSPFAVDDPEFTRVRNWQILD